MTSPPPLNDIEKTFLMHLRDRVDDPAAADHASMYAVGEASGLERDAAKHTAESLISLGLVEIRTLAGEISLTDDGRDLCAEQTDAMTGGPDTGQLSAGPVLTDDDRALVEQMSARLKTQAGDRSWQFDALTDLMADIKTIDVQLMSTSPKTAIIVACFQSVQATMSAAGLPDIAQDLGRAIGR